MTRRLAAIGLAFTLALGACSPSGIDMNHASSGAASADASAVGVNPAPVDAYRITMTINDAPGPFGSMRAIAHYDVTNPECLTPPKDNPGGRSAPIPTKALVLPIESAGDGVYRVTAYADYMQDEDYFGRGVCRWEFASFVVQMKATGAEGETLFVPAIPVQKLTPGGAERIYFNKAAYPRRESSDLAPLATGETNRSRFGASIRDDDLFTVDFSIGKDSTP